MEASINNKLDNQMLFADKLDSYKKSVFKLSNEYCNYEKFTPVEIALRQEKMAKIAKGIWRSSFIKSMS